MKNENRVIQYSLIIPVYNRPDEIDELLESMCAQTHAEFEVLIVEDGSSERCEHIIEKYKSKLNILYFFKANSGPGQSRNYGFARASGNYCIFLDSDCVLPPDYFSIVSTELSQNYVDAFGGPDEAHADFSSLQKAINYSMTSFFTTGGIRGSSEALDKFYPRSFNMGYSRDVFDATEGFAKMRFGEDIDMSIRILEKGFRTRLIKDAFVYHKRRTNLRQFFKQVFNSGIARINLFKRHPGSLKFVHFAPAVFVIGMLAIILFSIFISSYFLLLPLIYMLLIFLHATIKTKNVFIGMLSILTSFVQLFGYGLGFIQAVYSRIILGRNEFSAFEKNFYK